MNELVAKITASSIQLASVGIFLGIAAFWFLGIYLHLKRFRRARTGARHLVRIVLDSPMEPIARQLIQLLKKHRDFSCNISGEVDDVLMSNVKPKRGMGAGKTACNMACRFDQFKGETRVSARLDFLPLVIRAARTSQVVLFFIWPLWIMLTFIFVMKWQGGVDSLLDTLHLGHAIYPFFLLLFVHQRYYVIRFSLDDALTKLVRTIIP